MEQSQCFHLLSYKTENVAFFFQMLLGHQIQLLNTAVVFSATMAYSWAKNKSQVKIPEKATLR